MNILKNIIHFYIDGFKSMTVGRRLWLIIFIKLFIMFAILKFFFFPNILQSEFNTDEERGDYVIEQITNIK